MPDIDIDFADRQKLLDLIPHTRATIIDKKGIKTHNTGVYFVTTPSMSNDNQCSLDYQVADALGYFKVDLLNVNIYSQVKSRHHLQQLIDTPPPWGKLQDKEFVDQLFHLNNHFEVVGTLKPITLEQLAACLAIIRPAKRSLLHKGWDEILKHVWTKPTDNAYYFKKAHAMSYAMAVMIHMNLINSTD